MTYRKGDRLVATEDLNIWGRFHDSHYGSPTFLKGNSYKIVSDPYMHMGAAVVDVETENDEEPSLWMEIGELINFKHVRPKSKKEPAPEVIGLVLEPEYADAINEMAAELASALSQYPEKAHSQHEAFAVLDEERDELWEQVKLKQKNRNLKKSRSEALQVAAMAIRFAAEVCTEERGRK